MSTATLTELPERERTQFRAIRLGSFVDMEFRADGAKREFSGIAVPWDAEIDVDGWAYEVWRSGAFNHQLRAARRVKAANGHIPLGGDLIGSLREMRNDTKGLFVRGKVTEGVDKGDEALALMGDGSLDELSIGFYRVPGGDSVTRKADGRPLYEMRKADLFEVALVPFGAYGRKAKVDEVRAANALAGRERIVVRSLTILFDGQTAQVPYGGDIADAVRALLGPVSAPAPAPAEPAPAAVEPDAPGLAELDAVLAELPELNLDTADAA
jgi:HK97 family phage prohead protease